MSRNSYLQTKQAALGICFLVGLVLISYWSSQLSEGHEKYLQMIQTFVQKEHTNLKPKKKVLLIITYYRSGSSFLGQYFNQRNDTFYIFEPLVPFGDNCIEGSNESRQVEHLTNLFKCNMEDPQSFSKKIGALDDKKFARNLRDLCFKQNFCFRIKTKALCSEEFCNKTRTCSNCKPVNTTLASMKCKSADIVVIKVIRICRIEHLRPLLEDPYLDVKVLELVRDPRGAFASRLKLKMRDIYKDTSDTCNSVKNNWKFVQKNHEWIGNSYKLIRYEDVCPHPLEMGYQIYRFAGLAMTSHIKQWIEANTQGGISPSTLDSQADHLVQNFKIRSLQQERSVKGTAMSHAMNVSIDETLNKILLNHPFTTVRDSSAIWRKWISTLTFQNVTYVQNVCSRMMSIFNYVPITVTSQLQNTSTSVIERFCPENDLNVNGDC